MIFGEIWTQTWDNTHGEEKITSALQVGLIIFFIGTDIRSRIVSADIRPATISYTDHQAISVKINHKAESRGRGYFKLNSKIIENEEYKEIIKQYQNTRKKICNTKYRPKNTLECF